MKKKAMPVVIGMLMNNQILKYGDTVGLAVYGVIATIMSLFQALFGGVGQAINFRFLQTSAQRKRIGLKRYGVYLL